MATLSQPRNASKPATERKIRSAPAGGYAFAEKAEYRRKVWDAIAHELGDLIHTANVGMLPSSEGLEIAEALRVGVKEENIHAFDASAALLATAKWRADYPLVNVYAGQVDKSLNRVAAKGIKLLALNLDLCGGFTERMIQTVGNSLCSEGLSEAAVVCVTALKGRESPEFYAALNLEERHRAKALLVVGLRMRGKGRHLYTPCHSDTLLEGEYKSGTQVMQYCVSRVVTYLASRDEDHMQSNVALIASAAFLLANNQRRFMHSSSRFNNYYNVLGDGTSASRYDDRPKYQRMKDYKKIQALRNEALMDAWEGAVGAIIQKHTTGGDRLGTFITLGAPPVVGVSLSDFCAMARKTDAPFLRKMPSLLDRETVWRWSVESVSYDAIAVYEFWQSIDNLSPHWDHAAVMRVLATAHRPIFRSL